MLFATKCLLACHDRYNYVTLSTLRGVMAFNDCSDRALQDVAIHSARLAGEVSLTPAEHPCSSEERAAGILDHGDLLIFACLRD